MAQLGAGSGVGAEAGASIGAGAAGFFAARFFGAAFTAFFADLFAVKSFFFLPFLPFFFLALAIVILLLPPIHVYRALFELIRAVKGARSDSI